MPLRRRKASPPTPLSSSGPAAPASSLSGESQCHVPRQGWAAPLSCPPTGLPPAAVPGPTGQGCAGARLCPQAGQQRALRLFLLSFCSSRALKELWVSALLG